ncbi:MAG TPA: polysaccharide deacetylase family protein [Vicinamibacterales bacterium]|nr:polysaccharide deacetylase family protein [Vicinamibacterales bacterium]
MLIFILAIAAAVIAHVAPFPFLLDATDKTVWRMPRTPTPTVYLTFDDGPNPSATPQLLDVLAHHGVAATFFVIDKHITQETIPIVRRAFEEGHAVAIHWDSRELVLKRPAYVASAIQEAAARLELLTGHQACRAFRPHAGHRSIPMIAGAARAGYLVVGWSWMLWDFNWFRRRNADDLVPRLAGHASPGDIIVIHDGHHEDPRPDRRYAVETVDRLIPELKARGLQFGTICP